MYKNNNILFIFTSGFLMSYNILNFCLNVRHTHLFVWHFDLQEHFWYPCAPNFEFCVSIYDWLLDLEILRQLFVNYFC